MIYRDDFRTPPPASRDTESRKVKPKGAKTKGDEETLARTLPPFCHVGTVRQWLCEVRLGDHLSLNLCGYFLSLSAGLINLAAGLIKIGHHRCQCVQGRVRH
jgi:hypothetical protein